MSPFDLVAPSTRAEVLALLAEHGDEARLLAGGTGLLNLMKQRLAFPERLISLHRLTDLGGIEVRDGVVAIGALTRLAEIERDPHAARSLPMLIEALAEVASPRIRAMATLGGAVAHGDPHQDTPAALIALGASARVERHSGEREIALEDFYRDYYETALEPDELVTEVRVPVPPPASAASYVKYLPRSAEDYATVAAAVQLRIAADGVTCEQCRIVLGSVGATPIRSRPAEALLEGERLTAAACRAAGERAAEDADPIADTRGSAEYKRDMTAVFVRRALLDAAAKLGASPA